MGLRLRETYGSLKLLSGHINIIFAGGREVLLASHAQTSPFSAPLVPCTP